MWYTYNKVTSVAVLPVQCSVDCPSLERTSDVSLKPWPPINMRPPGEAQLP